MAVMHTSGTTAAPKPVELTYGNFLASALGSAVALGLDQAERWLCPMPLTHVGGLSIPIRSAIYATTAVLHGRFDTEAVLSELMDPGRRITLVSLVPTMLARLLDAGLSRPPTLRWALLGGGPIAPALLERAQDAGVPVAPTYGMTEACSQIATFGWPLPGVDVTHLRRRGVCPRPDRLRRRAVGGRLAAHRRSRAASTSVDAFRSPVARPTRSSPAARTWRRSRSSRCCWRIPPSPTPRSIRGRDPGVGGGGRRDRRAP